MIYIHHNGEKMEFEDADDAIEFLKKYKKELFQKELLTFNDKNSTFTFTINSPEIQRNCDKCVWQHSISCPGDSKHCDSYKKDAPDGGYYG